MTHEQLCEKALEAATAVFNDTSVEAEDTLASLNNLIEEIEVMTTALGG